MTSAYFRPNKKGKAVEAAGKRLQRRAPDFGTWWVRYRDAAGRLVRERTAASTGGEAERVVQEKALHAERVAAGLAPSAPVPMTCAELFEKYRESTEHLSSRAPLHSMLKVWFLPHFKKKPVAAVTPADCEALLNRARQEGKAPATVRQLHIHGRLFFKYGMRLGARRDNPWESVPRPKRVVKRPRFLSRAQVSALLAAAGSYRLLLLTAVLSGLRRGELAALQWGDIRWDEGPCGILYVQRSWTRDTTKSGQGRVVPVHPALRAELRAAYEAAPRGKGGQRLEPLVFPSPKGGLRDEAWHTAKLVRRLAARAGVELPEGFTFHDLRKTFLTHLIQDTGGNIGAGQLLAGHSTPAVTATYYLGRDVGFLVEAMEGLKLVEPSGQAAVAGAHTASTRRLKAVPSEVRSPKNGL